MRNALLVLALCASLVTAHAADPVGLRTRVPEGSIDTVDKADAALAAVQQARAAVNTDFLAGQKLCYAKFLAQACLDGLKATQRQRTAEIDAVELEAKRFKRTEQGQEAAAERQRHADERAAKAPQDAIDRAQRETGFQQKQTDAAASLEKSQTHAQTDAGRAQSYNAKVADAARKQQSEAERSQRADETRERNEQALADKLQDADERRERLAKKHAEKAADRARRAQGQAATPAPPPSATSLAPDSPAPADAAAPPAR